jgi:alpha-glucosidase
LNYYKALLRLRKTNAALRDGDFALVNESDKNVLAFVRTAGGKSVLVALNLTSKPQTVSFDLPAGRQAITVLSSFSKAGQSNNLKDLALPPFGAFVGQVSDLSH